MWKYPPTHSLLLLYHCLFIILWCLNGRRSWNLVYKNSCWGFKGQFVLGWKYHSSWSLREIIKCLKVFIYLFPFARAIWRAKAEVLWVNTSFCFSSHRLQRVRCMNVGFIMRININNANCEKFQFCDF